METLILALIMGGWLSAIFVAGSFIQKLEEKYARKNAPMKEKKNMETA